MESVREIDTIYTITARPDGKYVNELFHPAICTSLDIASAIVENNVDDFAFSGAYTWAIINGVRANTVMANNELEIEIWYKWHDGFGYVLTDDRPE